MRILFSALSVILLLAVLAACVESDEADDAADDNDVSVAEAPTATPEPDEPDPTATAEPEPTETAVPEEDDDADAGSSHVIEMQDPDSFVPDELEIAPGDTVTFVNEGNIPHTATLDPDEARDPDNVALPDGAETWDSGSLDPGDEFSITLDVPGEYMYICRPHEALGMIGTITVNGDTAGVDGDVADDVDENGDDDADGVDDYY